MTEMHQVAPYPDTLERLVTTLKAYPGWSFDLRDMVRDIDDKENPLAEGLTLIVSVVGYNSYHLDRGPTYKVDNLFPVPAATYDEASWTRWLYDCLDQVQTHELCECFRFTEGWLDDGQEFRPYSPIHAPGSNPYIVRELATDKERRTSFRGKVKETE